MKIKCFIKLFVSMILLFFVVRQVDWQDFADNFRAMSHGFLVLLIALAFLDRCFMGFKWRILLAANKLHISYSESVSLYLKSSFVGSFTPGNLGGDAYRVLSLKRLGCDSVVLSTVIIERIVGILSLIFFVICTIPFSVELFGVDGEIPLYISLLSAMAISLAFVLMIFETSYSFFDKLLCSFQWTFLIKNFRVS